MGIGFWVKHFKKVPKHYLKDQQNFIIQNWLNKSKGKETVSITWYQRRLDGDTKKSPKKRTGKGKESPKKKHKIPISAYEAIRQQAEEQESSDSDSDASE